MSAGLGSFDTLPQRAFAGLRQMVYLAEILLVGPAVVYELVDDAPVGQSAHAAVVDIEIGGQFATVRGLRVATIGVGRTRAVDGIKLEAAVAAIVHRLSEQPALARGPQHQLVVLGLQPLERGDGEGYLSAYLGEAVLHDGAVEIYCDKHKAKPIKGDYSNWI